MPLEPGSALIIRGRGLSSGLWPPYIAAARNQGRCEDGSNENLGPKRALVHMPSQRPSSIIFDFPQVGKGVDVDMPSSRKDDPGLVDIEACIAALDIDIG